MKRRKKDYKRSRRRKKRSRRRRSRRRRTRKRRRKEGERGRGGTGQEEKGSCLNEAGWAGTTFLYTEPQVDEHIISVFRVHYK